MENVISEILPYVLLYGVLGGFGIATVFNLLARGISACYMLFTKLS